MAIVPIVEAMIFLGFRQQQALTLAVGWSHIEQSNNEHGWDVYMESVQD